MTPIEAAKAAVRILAKGSVSLMLTHVDCCSILWGESERFQRLNRHESYFRGLQHADKRLAWDGYEHIEGTEYTRACVDGLMGGGRVDDAPWGIRRPHIRKQLCPAIVSRFTGEQYGESKVAALQSVDDDGAPDGVDYVEELKNTTDWWPKWKNARDLGGGVGCVVAGVQIVNFVPMMEVVNAKYCTPTWKGDKTYDRC